MIFPGAGRIKRHMRDGLYLDCLRGGGAEHAGQSKGLVVMVPCHNDGDRKCWDEGMLNHFHLYGIGLGDVPRGVYKGTVFLRWLTNRIYSGQQLSQH